MREAIGNSYVLNFIITFIILFMLIFVGMSTFTKAFKVKNKIVDILENYDGKIENSNRLNGDVQDEINEKLGSIGYRIDKKTDCKTDGRFSNGKLLNKTSNYRYCVYKFTTSKGDYYGVAAYAYLEIPLIGVKLEFPVYGETKIFYDL